MEVKKKTRGPGQNAYAQNSMPGHQDSCHAGRATRSRNQETWNKNVMTYWIGQLGRLERRGDLSAQRGKRKMGEVNQGCQLLGMLYLLKME